MSGVPYTGKDPATPPPSGGLCAKMGEQLSKNLWNAIRNITADIFFTDLKLANEFLNSRIIKIYLMLNNFATVQKGKLLR